MVLVERRVGGGDLALAEGVGERGVDGQGGDAEAGGGVAVDDELRAQAFVLLVGGDVLELGQLLHGGHQPGRPLVEFGDGVRGEGVLILRGGAAAADVEFLRALQVELHAGDVRGLRAQAVEDGFGSVAGLRPERWWRSASGLRTRNMLAELEEPPPGPPPPRKLSDVLDAGIFLGDVDELAHLLLHVEEGDVLLALNAAAETAGVLLREEAVGDDGEEIDVEAEGERRRRSSVMIWWRMTQRRPRSYSAVTRARRARRVR